MTQTTNTPKLPAGMAIIETANGRWFPALTPLTDTPHWVTILNAGAGLIPPALEPCHDPEKGYGSREEALEVCHTWGEAVALPVQWEKLAAHTEMYPERNAWYLDEIFHLSGDLPRLARIGEFTIAQVIVEHDGDLKAISTVEPSPDEAIEQLYQKVYARERETRHACAS